MPVYNNAQMDTVSEKANQEDKIGKLAYVSMVDFVDLKEKFSLLEVNYPD